ncbi:MAG: radical SAM protein, partial [Deltaproteobacteria bacterium]|nr:radical SAM protein [Deltaproteobacteria bacterium]
MSNSNQPRRSVLRRVGQLVEARFRWRHPLYLIHSLTARCNAKCAFCAWNFYEATDELSTAEIKQLYRDAVAAGFIGVSIWGGEPLVHRDVGELCRYAQGLGLITHMVTNGALIERKLDEVLPNLDRICISIDHPSEKHDELRGIDGLYERILEATRLVRSRYPKTQVLFVCTLLKDHAEPAALRELATVGRDLGAVVVFNAMRTEAAAVDSEGIDLARFNPSQAEISEA